MTDPQTPAQGSPTVRFFYAKSPQFRTIHVDGIYGGITPNGRYMHMALYTERVAIPQVVTNELTPEGGVGPETERQGKDGVMRELELDAIMDLPTARSLYDWLGRQLGILEAVAKETQVTPEGGT